MELSTQQKGSITEYRIISRLIERGFSVYKSCTEFSRTDIVVEADGKLFRVQCKTGRLRNGCIRISTHSNNTTTYEAKSYKGEVDFFGVYCFETDKCYMVPESICGHSSLYLRVEDALSSGLHESKYAKDYEL